MTQAVMCCSVCSIILNGLFSQAVLVQAQAAYESKAAPAGLVASPAPAQQAPAALSVKQGNTGKARAQDGASAKLQTQTETVSSPQTSAPQAAQAAAAAAPQSVTQKVFSLLSKPAESASRSPAPAAPKAAVGGESAGDDVELSPEELGFAGQSGDAFAALKAKMDVAQGKKKKKKDKDVAAVPAPPVPVLAASESAAAAVAVPGVTTQAGPAPVDSGRFRVQGYAAC